MTGAVPDPRLDPVAARAITDPAEAKAFSVSASVLTTVVLAKLVKTVLRLERVAALATDLN